MEEQKYLRIELSKKQEFLSDFKINNNLNEKTSKRVWESFYNHINQMFREKIQKTQRKILKIFKLNSKKINDKIYKFDVGYLRHLKKLVKTEIESQAPSPTLPLIEIKEYVSTIKGFCKYCSRSLAIGKITNQQCSKCFQYFHKICNLKNCTDDKNRKLLKKSSLCNSCL